MLISEFGDDDSSAFKLFTLICTSTGTTRTFKAFSSTILEDFIQDDRCILIIIDSDAASTNKIILSMFRIQGNFNGDLSSPAWICDIEFGAAEESKEPWAVFDVQRKANLIAVVGSRGSLHLIDLKTGAKRGRSNLCPLDRILSLKFSVDDSVGSFITKNEKQICYFEMKSAIARFNVSAEETFV